AAVWLGAAAAADRRLRRSPVVWATLAALAVEGALYVRGLDLPPQPAEPTADKVARLAGHTAKLFSLSPGWTSPETWWSSAALMAGPALAAVTMCVHAAARRPGERVRAAGLLAWLGGWLVLLAGVAWGRSGWRDLFLSRYVTLAVPLNAWVVLVAVLYGGRRWGWGVPLWLVAVQLYVYPGGIAIGRHCGVTHRQLMKEFEHDAKAGTPIPVLAERYADGLLFGQRAALCERLLELRAAGWRPFAGLPDDPYDAHDLPARDGEHVWLPGSAEVVAVRFAYHAPGGTAGELRVDTPAGPPPRPTRLSDRPGDHTAIVFLNRQTDNLGWQLTPTGHRVGQVTVIVPRGAWPGGRPWPE
ncbi:MAG: hypothetical protein K2X82_20290, partial [Gemmataceae bacterium]|nr:hypothetical protein [Gemmataceae bacterium]